MAIDTVFIFTAFWLAFILRLDNFDEFHEVKNWWLVFAITPLSLLSFIKLGLYRAVLRYINSQALWAILAGVILSTIYFVASSFFLGVQVPRTVPVIYACISLLFIGGSRLTVRAIVGKLIMRRKENVIIYGAGSAGRQLATALANGPEYAPVAFIDDDLKKQNTFIQGINVFHPDDIPSVANSKSASKILLALPSAGGSRRKEILNKIESFKLQVMTIPGMADIVAGNTSLEQVKEVGVEDLLGRDPVEPNSELNSFQ